LTKLSKLTGFLFGVLEKTGMLNDPADLLGDRINEVHGTHGIFMRLFYAGH